MVVLLGVRLLPVYFFYREFLTSTSRISSSRFWKYFLTNITIWYHCKNRNSNLSIIHKHMDVMLLKARAKYEIHGFIDYSRSFSFFILFLSIIFCCFYFDDLLPVVKHFFLLVPLFWAWLSVHWMYFIPCVFSFFFGIWWWGCCWKAHHGGSHPGWYC